MTLTIPDHLINLGTQALRIAAEKYVQLAAADAASALPLLYRQRLHEQFRQQAIDACTLASILDGNTQGVAIKEATELVASMFTLP